MMTILLYGFLGSKFGKVHKYDVSSPAEAVRALSATIKGFKQALIDGGSYKILIGGSYSISEKELKHPISKSNTIRIIPVVEGRKSGLGKIILGIVIVVVAVVTWQYELIPAYAASFAGGIGVSLIMGGVSQLLYSGAKSDQVDAELNKSSHSFDGPLNTTAQGNAVPICYGKLLVGSQVISAGLSVEQLT